MIDLCLFCPRCADPLFRKPREEIRDPHAEGARPGRCSSRRGQVPRRRAGGSEETRRTYEENGISAPRTWILLPYMSEEWEPMIRWDVLSDLCDSTFSPLQGWVCGFEKPQTSPNSLSPSTTVLSPYVTIGCLSARTFWWRLTDVYQGVSVTFAVQFLGDSVFICVNKAAPLISV